MIKIGICDDEKIYRDKIREFLCKYMEKELLEYEIFEYESAEELEKGGERLTFLFLDIEMGQMDGIRLKEKLSENEDVRIVFITSHTEFIAEAFGKNVYGFLVKPVEEDKFAKYLRRMIMDLEDDKIYMFPVAQGEIALKMKSVLYIHAERKYCSIITRAEKIFCGKSMGQLEQELPEDTFCRCHKSYLVNLFHVRKSGAYLIMTNGDKIPVGRLKQEKIQKEYRKYAYRKAR